MKKTTLEIYAMAVCFVAVVCFIISMRIASYAVVGIVSPEFTMPSWAYAQHQTNDAFWNPQDRKLPVVQRGAPLAIVRTDSKAVLAVSGG
ncbi:MAG: hypothetical protein ACKVOO_13250 [Burkholderiaceae bacterium]